MSSKREIDIYRFPCFWKPCGRSVSYSKIDTFLKCPLQWYFKYVKYYSIEKDIVAINLGVAIHTAIEKSDLWSDSGLSKREQYKQAVAIFQEAWEQLKEEGKAVEDNRTDYSANLTLGALLLKEYVKNYDIWKDEKVKILPVTVKYPDGQEFCGNEIPFRIPIISLSNNKVFGRRHNLIGFIDWLGYIPEQNAVVVLDHKISSILPNDFILWSNLQLPIYQYVIQFLLQHGCLYVQNNQIKDAKIYTGYNYLLKPYKGPQYKNRREKPEFQRKTLDSELPLDNILSIIANALKDMEVLCHYPVPHYNDECNWRCDYKDACIAYRIGQDPLEALIKTYGKENVSVWTPGKSMKPSIFDSVLSV